MLQQQRLRNNLFLFLVLLILLMILLLTSGCIKTSDKEHNKEDETKTCEPGWFCIDDYNIGYRDENCVFKNISFCRKGCYYDRCIDKPDLVVIEIKYPSNISSGQKVKFFSIIQNVGSAPLLAELPCEADNKKTAFDTKWYVDGRQIAYWCHNNIMPNQVHTNYMTWVAEKGIHNITVIVDGSDFIEESDEKNNQKSILVEVK